MSLDCEATFFILVQFLQSIKSEVANEASAIIMPCSSYILAT